MKVAVTSQNFKTVTNHAGRARRFIVFEVGENKILTQCEQINLAKNMCMHEFGDSQIAHPLDAMDAVLSASFCSGFASKMATRNVLVSLTEETDPTKAVEAFLVHGQKLPSSVSCCESNHHFDHSQGHSHKDDLHA